jgi:uncharacterized protein (TIGR02466 family)
MEHLFTTPVKIISLNNYQKINETLGRCSTLGFIKNFNENLPKDEAQDIEKVFKDEAECYMRELTGKNIDLEMMQSWTTITNKYGYQTPHEHSGNSVLAVYYIQTSDNCGDLLLHDPRGATSFIPNFETDTSGEKVSGRSYFKITPKTGDLILFPGYVIHSVQPNMSDNIRLSLAINFKYKHFDQFK